MVITCDETNCYSENDRIGEKHKIGNFIQSIILELFDKDKLFTRLLPYEINS